MSLHPLVGVFMIVWVVMVVLMGLPGTLGDLAQGGFGEGRWIPPGMLIFGWVLCSGAFTIEARIARKRLAALLEGTVPER
jgi:type VI protein secretion system component VasK